MKVYFINDLNGLEPILAIVDCVGLTFSDLLKQKYPSFYHEHLRDCRYRKVILGVPRIYTMFDGRKIVSVPLRNHPLNPLNNILLADCFVDLKKKCIEWDIDSFIVPSVDIDEQSRSAFNVLIKNFVD